jgi:NADH dehydrogenase
LSEICPLAKIIQADVQAINHLEKTVSYSTENNNLEKVVYDHLVVGTGSVDRKEVKGIEKFAFGVKYLGALGNIHKQILHVFKQAATETEQEKINSLLSFVVIGAGFAGVEIAANLKEYIDKLQKKYPTLHKSQPKVYLINSSEKVLPQINNDFKIMAKYCQAELDKYHVQTINKVSVTSIGENEVALSNGQIIRANTVITTAGQKPVVIKGLENLVNSPDGRIETNQYLQVSNADNLWVGGDMAKVLHRSKKFYCPPNALWAIKHGTWIGENIYRTLANKKLKPFDFYGLGQAACLGIGKGTNELYGIQMTGWVAWVVRIGFFMYFLPSRKSIPKVAKALYNSFSGQEKIATEIA